MLNSKLENFRLSDISNKKINWGKILVRSYHSIIKPFKQFASLPGLRQLIAFIRRLLRVMERPTSLNIQTVPQPPAQEDECKGLTVISANLWHDWPQYRRSMKRLEAFSSLVEEHQADILLLQEVSRTTRFQTDEWLSQRLGMTSIYSRANGHQNGIGFEEGLAVFSRHPLGTPVLRQLSSESNPFVHRLALGTQVSSPCGKFLAFSVHLSINGRENTRQAEHLHHWVNNISETMPAVVGGDFNADEHSKSITSLRQKWVDTFRHLNPLADGTTHEIHWPWKKPLRRARLDYIFLKAEQAQWHLLDALHLETPGEKHSDHRAVLLRFAPAVVKIQP